MGKQQSRRTPKTAEQILAEAKSNGEVNNNGAYTGEPVDQEFIKPSNTGQVLTHDQVKAFRENNTSGIFNPQEASQYNHGLHERKKRLESAKKATQEAIANAPQTKVEAAVKEEDADTYKSLKELKKEKKQIDSKNISWSEKLALLSIRNADTGAGAALNVLSKVLPDDWGVNETDTKKTEELDQKIHAIQAPHVRNFIAENQSVLEKDMEAYRQIEDDNAAIPSMDKARLEMAMMKRKKMIRDAQAYVNKEGFWSGFLDRDGVVEAGTMGMMSLVENALLVGPTVAKKERGEELTFAEKRLLATTAEEQEFGMEKQDLDYNYGHKMGEGVMHSVGFMTGLAGAGKVTGGIRVGNKLATMGVQALVNAAIMPSTYGNIGENYAGQIEYDVETNQVFVRKELQNKMVGEMQDMKAAALADHKKLSLKLAQGGLTDIEKEQYEELEQRLGYHKGKLTFDQIIDATKEQYEPMSMGRSIQHGYTSNLAEAVAERIGGHYIDKGLDALAATRGGQLIGQTKNALNKYDRKYTGGLWRKGKDFFNSFSGNQLNSIPSEMLEEYIVSPLHALNDWSTQPLTEWSDVQSHIDVAVQTAIMGVGFRSFGAGMSYYDKYKNPELHAERKRLKKTFQTLNNAVSDADVRESVDMFTSVSRAGFDAQQAKVKKMKSQGKNKEAELLEKKLFRNMVLGAFRTGTVDDFKESLEKMSTNANLDRTTVEQAQKALGKLENVQKTYEQYKDLPNVDKMVEMTMNVQEARENIKILDDHYTSSQQEAFEEVKEWTEENDLDMFTMDEILGNDQSLERQEELDAFRTKLAEAELTSVEKVHANRLAKEETKGVIKDLKSEMKRQSSKEYQTSLKQKAVFVDAFNKEYQNRAHATWKKADDKTKIEYRDRAEDIFRKKGNSITRNFDLGTEALAKKLYKKDIARADYKLTEDEVDNIASSLPGAVKKGLSQYDMQDIIGQYKTKIKIARMMKARKEADDSKKEFPPQKPDTKEPEDELGKKINQTHKELVNAGGSQADTESVDSLFGDEMPMAQDPSREQTKQIGGLVEKAIKDITDETGVEPDFKSLVQTFADKLGKETTKTIFDKLAMGWTYNEKSADFEKVYREVFDPLKESLSSIATELQGFDQTTETSEEEVIRESEQTKEDIQKEQSPKVFKKNVSSNMTYQAVGGGMTTSGALQLGFSALNYTNRIIGGVKKKVTVFNNQLREAASINFRELIDPTKNNVGDQLFIAQAKPETWGSLEVRTGYDDKGDAVMENFQSWVDRKQKEYPEIDFTQTDEFIDMLPVYATNNQGIPLAYIHDTSWYNRHNVADPAGEPTSASGKLSKAHQEAIDQGKENVRQLRRMVIQGEINKIEITKKKEGIYYEIPVDQPLITIEEANPQSMIAIQKGKSLLVAGKKMFTENDKRIIVNKKGHFDNTQSHLWDLRLIGYNKKGVPMYRAFKVFRKADNGMDGIPDSSFETMKWMYAAHAVLSDNKAAKDMYNKNIKGTKYDMSVQKAEQIVREVMKISRINIKDLASVHNFIESYGGLTAKTKDGTPTRANIFKYAEKMYKPDTNGNSFGGNGNLDILTNAKNIPLIDADGVVTDTGKNYEGFLKSTLKTRVKSFNVGTQEKPSYATSIQPVISYKPVGDFAEEVPDLQEIERKKETSNQRTKEALQAFDVEPSDPLFTEAEENLIESFEESVKTSGFDVNELSEDVELEDLDMEELEGLIGDEFVIPIDDLDALKNIFNVAGKLTQKEENFVVKFLYHNLLETIDTKHGGKVTKQVLFDELKNSFEQIVSKDRSAKREQLKALIPLYKKDPNSRLKKYLVANKVILEKYKSIEDNWNSIVDKAVEHATKYTEIKESLEELDENYEGEANDRTKDYTKESIEESAKQKTSYALRRFMSGIADKDANGKDKTGPFGLTDYLSFNDVFNSLAQFMNAETDIEPDFDTMMAKIKEMAEGQPWVNNLLDKLENHASEQLKRQFVQVYAKHALSMKFTMYSVDNNGTVLKLYDTNANEITRIVRDGWKNHFKATSNLVSTSNGYHINKEYAKILLAKFRELSHESDDKSLRDFMSEFGLEIANETWNELKEGAFYSSTGERVKFEDQFNSNSGIFKKLGDYLNKITIEEDTEFEIKEKNHPHFDMNSILKTLSRMQAKYSTQSMTLTFRDGSKQISGQVPPSYVTDMISRLKTDAVNGERGIIKKLQGKSLTKQSTMLQLLEKEGGFAGKFAIHHVGITALKQLGKSSGSFSSITDLNSKDHDLVKLGGIQDMKQGEIGMKQWGISMRVGNIFLPTMSDKTRMMLLQTGIFNFFSESTIAFQKTDDGKIILSDSTRELLYEKLVLPELSRIMTYHKKNTEVAGSANTNVKNYDKAAQIFNFLPELNNVKVGEKGIRLIKHIATNPAFHDLDFIESNAKEQLIAVVEEYILEKSEEKRELWESFTERSDKGEITKLPFFDKDYLANGSGTMDEKFEMASLDYVLNNTLTNADSLSVFAGDIALYAKEGDFKGEQPYEQEDDFYKKFAEKTDVNVGKRMALLIAPGTKLANSVGKTYRQVFLSDVDDISENTEYLIKSFYGEQAFDDNVVELIAEYNSTEDKSLREGVRKQLTKMFPEIGDYFNIESTDAQEYTTIKEHMEVMYDSGRISDSDYQIITKKIELQKEAERKGESIPENALITKEEMQDIILQPMKPVYTGQIEDAQDVGKDLMRTVYVKSSSFPLIPQFTAGTQLDDLRQKMEQIENETGKNIRASYQTANKVGAVKNAVDAFSPNTNISMMLNASLELNREDFKIQQDVPFKSDKKKKDEISMGTQMFKLLMGNGIMSMEGFKLPHVIQYDANGREIKPETPERTFTGSEMQDYYTKVFAKMVDIKKQELYTELGLDTNGKTDNMSDFAQKIQALLHKEASKRNYPLQDIKGLELEEKQDTKGNTYYDFKIPLWLATNGNRYESLLNSIVTNRVMKHKIPGNSFVVGSESGMKFKEQDENGKIPGIETSRIIYLDSYNGKELQAVKHEEGDPNNPTHQKFKKAQVFIPSKFKDPSGKLIDMFEDYQVDPATGKRSGKYIFERDNGSLGLRKSMFDQELLSGFSFRTPTSSHVSGSVIEIAGFLPPESGDLMIVPRNFTKQKGLDFDVDKENMYALNHVQNYKTGKVEVLTAKHKQKRLIGLEKALEKLQSEGAFAKKEMMGTGLATFDKMFFSKYLGEVREQLGEEFTDELGEELIEEVIFNPEYTIEQKMGRIEREYDQKLMENEFIRVHKSIFQNPSTELQNKINAVLSMEFAKGQAELIDGLRSSDSKGQFSLLSEEHQKRKMGLGAAGKLAIGVYSNFLTFHGLSQQSTVPVYVQEKVPNEDGEGFRWEAKDITIGNITNKGGKLGLIKTLDGGRDVSEVFGEKQNTATDNEKEQILGRVNINSTTINVDSLLTALGFDKADNGNSVSYQLLSQPVMFEYVERLANSRGISAEYNPDAQIEIIEDLIEKYGKGRYSYDTEYDVLVDNTTEQIVDLETELTGTAMLNSIGTKEPDGEVQIAALVKFLELDKMAKKMSAFQKVLNVNNLGKSIVESNDMYDRLVDTADTGIFANLNNLIGTFAKLKEGEAVPEGYHLLDGGIMVKPNTAQGAIVVNGLVMAQNLWSGYFPYADPAFKHVIQEVFAMTNVDMESDYKRIETTHEVVKEIKKYIYSGEMNGLFVGNPADQRAELFIDSDNNTSLARYLATLGTDENSEFAKGLKVIKNNKLMNKLTYEVNTDGSPSIVKYNNTSSDNFDEDYLYNSFPEMILENKPLPPKNGQPYNTRMLAQELITYAYLEGGVQEAIQFIKYVPIEYLQAVKIQHPGQPKRAVNEMFQMYSSKRSPGIFRRVLGVPANGPDSENQEYTVSAFTRQYIQHHPEKATQFTPEERAKLFAPQTSEDGVVETFVLRDEEMSAPKFISIKQKTRSKKKQDKYHLYERTSPLGYTRIDALGTHGMNEYQYIRDNRYHRAKSIIKPEKKEVVVKKENETPVPGKKANTDNGGRDLGLPFGVNHKSSIDEVIENITNSNQEFKNYPHIKEMINYLKPMLKDGIRLNLTTRVKAGSYAHTDNTMHMNPEVFKNYDPETFARVFLHELTHAVTSKELRKYINEDGLSLKQGVNPPDYLYEMMSVFQEYRRLVGVDNLNEAMKRKGTTAWSNNDIIFMYPASSIFEFASGIMTEPRLQERLSQKEYKSSGKSFVEKFRDIIGKMLTRINPEKTTLAEGALGSLFEFIEAENNQGPKPRTKVPSKLPAEQDWEKYTGVKMGESYYFPDKQGDINYGTVVERSFYDGVGDVYTLDVNGARIVVPGEDIIVKNVQETAQMYREQEEERERFRKELNQEKEDNDGDELPLNSTFTQEDIDNLPDCL